MVDKNDSLLREVEDELRQDQLKKLWNDYGTYLFGAAALLIVGVFVWQQVDASRRAAAEAEGARYEAARRLLLDKKAPEADAAFAAIAKSAPAGYSSLARLEVASGLVKAGKGAEAISSYDAIAADPSLNPVMRDFARLQAASLKLGTAEFPELQNRLSGLTDEQNGFRALARELLGLAAQKAGKNDDARKLFLQVVGDAKASQTQKDRVSGYLTALISADLGKAASEPAPAAAQPNKK